MLLAATVVCALSPGARADDRQECLQASADGQRLRHAHDLLQARERLRACARPECPGLVQSDCQTWLGEVDRDVPTVVLGARDAAGGDRVDVRVTADGAPLAARLDGTAVPMNPGVHVLRFEGSDGSTVDVTVLVREGEKDRPVEVVLGSRPAAPGPVPSASPASSASPAPSASSAPSASPAASAARGEREGSAAAPSGAHRAWGLALGAVGLAGLVTGTVSGLVAIAQANAQRTECSSPTSCPHHADAIAAHGTATTAAGVSTVGFAAGGVLLAAGALFYFGGTF